MIRTYKEGNLYYTPESFFLAVITAVGPLTAECANFPCSWRQYPLCNNGANPLTEVKQAIMSGDYTKNNNTAYPIDFNTPPFVGQQVLMRFRMIDDNGNNVYEFIMNGGGGGDGPSGCMVVTSVQCSNNVLQVVQSNASGCASCTGGLVFYIYGDAFEIPNNTNILLPNRWILQTGDLTDCGLEFDGDKFINNSGQQLNLKVTLQLYFTPASVSGQSRWASIVRNNDFNDIPIASFSASNNTFAAIVASNFISLADGEWFGPAAYQNGGAGVSVGGDQRVPTSLLIEKLCL
jgi:hypothetical protein